MTDSVRENRKLKSWKNEEKISSIDADNTLKLKKINKIDSFLSNYKSKIKVRLKHVRTDIENVHTIWILK